MDESGVDRTIFWYLCDRCAYMALNVWALADVGTVMVVLRYVSIALENRKKGPSPVESQPNFIYGRASYAYQ